MISVHLPASIVRLEISTPHIKCALTDTVPGGWKVFQEVPLKTLERKKKNNVLERWVEKGHSKERR